MVSTIYGRICAARAQIKKVGIAYKNGKMQSRTILVRDIICMRSISSEGPRVSHAQAGTMRALVGLRLKLRLKTRYGLGLWRAPAYA